MKGALTTVQFIKKQLKLSNIMTKNNNNKIK